MAQNGTGTRTGKIVVLLLVLVTLIPVCLLFHFAPLSLFHSGEDEVDALSVSWISPDRRFKAIVDGDLSIKGPSFGWRVCLSENPDSKKRTSALVTKGKALDDWTILADSKQSVFMGVQWNGPDKLIVFVHPGSMNLVRQKVSSWHGVRLSYTMAKFLGPEGNLD